MRPKSKTKEPKTKDVEIKTKDLRPERTVNALVPILVFAVFFGVIITVVVLFARYAKKLERERTLGLKSSATLLGWQFAEEAPLNYLPNLDNFALFGQGHSKQIKNLMYGETNGVKAALFDYIYTVGHGKHRHTYYQSVVYFEPRNLNIPFFSLRPENVLHKLISALGYQDIDFGQSSNFFEQVSVARHGRAGHSQYFQRAVA